MVPYLHYSNKCPSKKACHGAEDRTMIWWVISSLSATGLPYLGLPTLHLDLAMQRRQCWYLGVSFTQRFALNWKDSTLYTFKNLCTYTQCNLKSEYICLNNQMTQEINIPGVWEDQFIQKMSCSERCDCQRVYQYGVAFQILFLSWSDVML